LRVKFTLLMEVLQFSATSLQDFVDCQRRFQLRHLWEVAWPAPETDAPGEQETYARLGRELHGLIHQHLLGFPVETLSDFTRDPELDRWWQAYLAYAPALGNARVIPEVALSISLCGHRLVARYDAIVMSDEDSVEQPRFTIFDWKTYRRRPTRQWLASRLQTRIYPLVLVQAGMRLNDGQPIRPGDIEMRYWLAGHAAQVEAFVYNQAAYESDLKYAEDLTRQVVRRVEEAASRSALDEPWALTDNWQRCRFCVYRSLCKRGVVGGPLGQYIEGSEPEGEEPQSQGEGTADWGQIQDTVY
jgi:hypothetical protein